MRKGDVKDRRKAKQTKDDDNGCKKDKKRVLHSNAGLKKTGKTFAQEKHVGVKKGEKRGTPYCRPSKRVSSKTPKTASEMTTAEKRSRISQKKRLGQPAGKPKRVKSLKRKKK